MGTGVSWGCGGSQQNWKVLEGSFLICEPTQISLLEMITKHLAATQDKGGAFNPIEEG